MEKITISLALTKEQWNILEDAIHGLSRNDFNDYADALRSFGVRALLEPETMKVAVKRKNKSLGWLRVCDRIRTRLEKIKG